MVIIIMAALGCFTGLGKAKKKNGNRADKIQYAVAYAILFAIVGLFLTIILEKLL